MDVIKWFVMVELYVGFILIDVIGGNWCELFCVNVE